MEKHRNNKKNPYSKRRSSGNREQVIRNEEGEGIRLNKYIANAGICSRREADTLIESGVIKINGKTVTQLGTKVMPGDVVKYAGGVLKGEKNVYLLLNKPKAYITTMDDPENRRTVMMLVEKACPERIYPVGRLDRNTSGVLLFTNDGEMAKRLTHPKHVVHKVYHVQLEQPLSKTDMLKIASGIKLEDGVIKPDKIEWVGDGKDRKQVGIELHSGRNRIVRRIFEALEYKIVKLDRVVFAGLTKKNLPRGRWRFLEKDEINLLKRI